MVSLQTLEGYFSPLPHEETVLIAKPAPHWSAPLLALAAGLLGMTAVWATVATVTGSSQAWLAVVTAIDMALLLRLTGMPAGPMRALAGASATLATCLASYWLMAANQFASILGLPPLESAWRLGPVLALEMTRLGGGWWDVMAIAFALIGISLWGCGQRER